MWGNEEDSKSWLTLFWFEQDVGIAPSAEEPWKRRGSVKGEERAFRLGQDEFEELVRHSRRDEKGVHSDIKKPRFKREI